MPYGLFLWAHCTKKTLRLRRLRRQIELRAVEWKRQNKWNSLKLRTFGGRALLLLRMIYLFIYYADADSAQLMCVFTWRSRVNGQAHKGRRGMLAQWVIKCSSPNSAICAREKRARFNNAFIALLLPPPIDLMRKRCVCLLIARISTSARRNSRRNKLKSRPTISK